MTTPPSHNQHTEGREKHFAALEDFLGHVDGCDLTHWGDDGNGGTAGLDEGTCDATEAFAAFEFIKVDHAYLSNRVKALEEALRGISTWRRDADSYDKDCDNPSRLYCEDVELIELAALRALTHGEKP